jgi:hypothetical protein
MTVTTEDGGRQNLFAKEPPMEIMDVTETHNEKAEKLEWTSCYAWCHGGFGCLCGTNYPRTGIQIFLVISTVSGNGFPIRT